MTSEQLTALALRARTDEDALDELMEHEAPIVQGWVVGSCHSAAELNDADDISQEILRSVAEDIYTFGGRSSYKRWVYRVMRGRLVDWRRKCRAGEKYVRLYAEGEDALRAGSYEMLGRLESEEAFDELVGLAAEGNRDSLRRMFAEGYRIKDIAASDGISWNCARDRVRRGLRQIKSGLEKDDEKTVFDGVI